MAQETKEAASSSARWATAAAVGMTVGGALGVGLSYLPAFGGGDGNYQYSGIFSSLIQNAALLLLCAWTGAYALAGVRWAKDDSPSLPSPGLLAIAAFFGGLFGDWMSVIALSAIPVTGYHPWGQLALLPGVFGGAWGLAWLAARQAGPARYDRRQKGLHVAGVLLVLTGGGLYALADLSPWPGDQAPAARRAAWAHEKFGKPFDDTAAHVRADPDVRKALGEVREVAPIAGENRVSYTSDGTAAGFTVVVEGASGTALAATRYENYGRGIKISGKLDAPHGPVTFGPEPWPRLPREEAALRAGQDP